MSEVKRYLINWHMEEAYPRTDGEWCKFDDVQSELAALREELAEKQALSEVFYNRQVLAETKLKNAERRLASSEQRNAALIKAISDAEYRADQGKIFNGMGWTYTGLHSHGQQKVLDILRTALNPTESAASE